MKNEAGLRLKLFLYSLHSSPPIHPSCAFSAPWTRSLSKHLFIVPLSSVLLGFLTLHRLDPIHLTNIISLVTWHCCFHSSSLIHLLFLLSAILPLQGWWGGGFLSVFGHLKEPLCISACHWLTILSKSHLKRCLSFHASYFLSSVQQLFHSDQIT